MPSLRQYQIFEAGLLGVIAFFLVFVSKNYELMHLLIIIGINMGLSLYSLFSYQWDIILSGVCLVTGLMLGDPVGRIFLGSRL